MPNGEGGRIIGSDKNNSAVLGDEKAGCPARFQLTRAVVGDMTDAEIERVRAHVATCSSCRAFWEWSQRQQAAFLEQDLTDCPMAGILAEAQRRIRNRKLLLLLVPVTTLVAAAIVVFVVLLPVPNKGSIRVKGGDTSIGFYLKRGELVQPGTSGMVVRADDQIQFT